MPGQSWNLRKRITSPLLLLYLILQNISIASGQNPSVNKQKLINIKAFSYVYGHVRYFYPEELSTIDWNRFLQYGIDKVSAAEGNEELKSILDSLLTPFAPHVKFLFNKAPFHSGVKQGDTIQFWQHLGFGMGENQGARDGKDVCSKLVVTHYDSLKVIHNYDFLDPVPNRQKIEYFNYEKLFSEDTYFFKQNFSETILEIQPDAKEALQVEIANGLWMVMPTAIKVSHTPIKNKLSLNSFAWDAFQPIKENYLADYIFFWNIIQHFYPYRKYAENLLGFSWDKELESGLSKMLKCKDIDMAIDIIRSSLKLLQDPHADLFNTSKLFEGPDPRKCWPFDLHKAENKYFVSKSLDNNIRSGDEIIKVDGVTIDEWINQEASEIIGPHRFQIKNALSRLGVFWKPGKQTIELIRDKKRLIVQFELIPFKNIKTLEVNQFDHEGIERVSDGIWYINPSVTSATELMKNINVFLQAKNIIIDLRDYPKNIKSFDRHLISKEFARGLIGSTPVFMNSNQNPTFYSFQMALDVPETPIIEATLSVLIDSSTISRGETRASWLKDLGATLYGETTAGAAGGINWFTTPSKLQFQLTSSYNLQPNGANFQIIGIQPDKEIVPKAADLSKGIDSVLNQVIEILESKND